jgi:hypothetical protein
VEEELREAIRNRRKKNRDKCMDMMSNVRSDMKMLNE